MKRKIIIYLLILFSVFMVKDVDAINSITYKYTNINNANQSFTTTIKNNAWCRIVFPYGVQCENIYGEGVDLNGDINWGAWDFSPFFSPNIKEYLSASIDNERVITFYKNNNGLYKQSIVAESDNDFAGVQCNYYKIEENKKGPHIKLEGLKNETYKVTIFNDFEEVIDSAKHSPTSGIVISGDFQEFIQKNSGKCPNYANYNAMTKKFYVGTSKQNGSNLFILNGQLNCADTVSSIKLTITELKSYITQKIKFLNNCYDENSKKIICDQSEVAGASRDINEGPLFNYSNELNKINLNLCQEFKTYVDEEKAELVRITSETTDIMNKINNAINASDRLQNVTDVNSNGLNSFVDNDFVLPEDNNYDTCESLMGSELVKFLNDKIFGSIKIIAPILLILFGSLDFGKAVLSDDKDALSKASKNFIKRAIAVVAIFFVPTIINIIFSLVDGINGSTCGIH